MQHAINHAQQGFDQVRPVIARFRKRVPRTIKRVVRAVKTALTDFSGGVNDATTELLFLWHLWGYYCLFAYTRTAYWTANYLCYGVVQALFGVWVAMAAAFVLVPPAVYGCGEYFVTLPVAIKSLVLVLAASAALGLLDGSISSRYTTITNPTLSYVVFGTGASVAVLGPIPAIKNSRRIFVSAAMASSFILCIIVIALVGWSSSYFVYLAVQLLAALIDMQIKIKNANYGVAGSMALEQWKTVVIMATADWFAFCLLSMSDHI